MEKKIIVVCVIAAGVILAGCVRITGTGGGGNDGGIYKSVDGSKNWTQKVSIPEINGQVVRFPLANILKIVIDPSDHNAVYLATESDGLLYSFDGGERWQRTRQFARGMINDVAIDYGSKCTLYIAIANKIYKSTDCARVWDEVYFDTRTDVQINDVETESYNKNVVYAGTNKGDLLKSTDYGASWSVVKRARQSIRQILVDKNDTRIVYIGTSTAGLFKTTDGGRTWSDDRPETDINTPIKKYSNALNFIRMSQDFTSPNTLVMASRYGLLRTRDGGSTWEDIKLVTPAGGATITSLAVDQKNGDVIYYGTNTTFYKSVNGGQNWVPSKLPTSRESSFIAVDPLDSNVLYLGTRLIKR